MFGLGAIRTFFLGSKTARFVAACLAAIMGLWVYGQFKYWQGGAGERTAIVKKSNKEAIKKNKKASKVRRSVPVSAARKRLLEYARPD